MECCVGLCCVGCVVLCCCFVLCCVVLLSSIVCVLGRFLLVFGASWVDFWSFGGVFGVVLGRFGLILGYPGGVLESLEGILGDLEAVLGRHGLLGSFLSQQARAPGLHMGAQRRPR